MSTAKTKLENYLLKLNNQTNIEQLTPDASTREYFRINWNNTPAIVCVYPESFNSKELPYLDTTNLFSEGDLPVAEIYDVAGDHGIVIMQDFGKKILREVLETADSGQREKLINETISLIAKIQKLTLKAFELNSIASKLKFDEEKLLWELNFFKTHYFGSLQKDKLEKEFENALTEEFVEISRELENYATVLTHRDFHAANLMVDEQNNLQIIDHQDARIGSVTYDLVSLLLDRVLETPEKSWLDEKKRFLLVERESLGLEEIDFEKFDYEFDLMSIQRCLKAIGTFANQTANLDKTGYTRFIKPMFLIVLEACERLERFPVLQYSIKLQLKRL